MHKLLIKTLYLTNRWGAESVKQLQMTIKQINGFSGKNRLIE